MYSLMKFLVFRGQPKINLMNTRQYVRKSTEMHRSDPSHSWYSGTKCPFIIFFQSITILSLVSEP